MEIRRGGGYCREGNHLRAHPCTRAKKHACAHMDGLGHTHRRVRADTCAHARQRGTPGIGYPTECNENPAGEVVMAPHAHSESCGSEPAAPTHRPERKRSSPTRMRESHHFRLDQVNAHPRTQKVAGSSPGA